MAWKRLLILSFVALIFALASAIDVSYDDRSLIIDGERKFIISGAIHYPRSTPSMWADLIAKAKEGGLNTIETYVFWDIHEPNRRQYDFTGNKDIIRFIKTVQSQGLYLILRIGPYVCAEWNYGGFPVWLHKMPNITFRTNNPVYQHEMKTFMTKIVDMMKYERLFAPQGGPIILAQIENEYAYVEKYTTGGKEYVEWCAQLAVNFAIGVPWIMCHQSDAPPPMINTHNGFYGDGYKPNRNNAPRLWTENWTGWFQAWGEPAPHRPAKDVAFAVARFFERSGSGLNYYMYHGGTNFGHTSGGPLLVTSYDYDAPLDEYGNLNQPKWGHLKRLHELIYQMEKTLLYGVRSNIVYQNENMMFGTVYSYQGKQSCFLGNAFTGKDLTVDLFGTNYTVPAWSVTILPDCFTEAYNTAKVSTQTSVMVKKPNLADDGGEPYNLKWEWRPEPIASINAREHELVAHQLLDQKTVTVDKSDYLWYMTSIDVKNNDPLYGKPVTLHIRTEGHVLHVFLNKVFIGRQWSDSSRGGFDFVKQVKLKLGHNNLVLLSATVGLANFNYGFDKVKVGVHGPVELIDKANNVTKDLSSNKWTYQVGLTGEKRKIYMDRNPRLSRWISDGVVTDKMFVWYKTTFPTPIGTDPIVVDLLGLGKGEAWVNGNSLGRYWPSYTAVRGKCNVCYDDRQFSSDYCRSNCGKPSQRWYHIPPDFLKEEGDNKLILFEEFGGTPELASIQTVTIEKACAHAYEGSTLQLSCQGGRSFREIRFASFGEPNGVCGSFQKGSCEAPKTLSIVEENCLGKQSCSLPVNEDFFGPTGCHAATYRLAVEAIC